MKLGNLWRWRGSRMWHTLKRWALVAWLRLMHCLVKSCMCISARYCCWWFDRYSFSYMLGGNSWSASFSQKLTKLPAFYELALLFIVLLLDLVTLPHCPFCQTLCSESSIALPVLSHALVHPRNKTHVSEHLQLVESGQMMRVCIHDQMCVTQVPKAEKGLDCLPTCDSSCQTPTFKPCSWIRCLHWKFF